MGGAEMQIKYLVRYLVSKGYKVSYIFEDKGKSYSNELSIDLCPLQKRKIKKTFGSRWIFYHRSLLKKLDELQPDIVYTRFYSSWSGLVSQYAKSNNKTHIWALASDNDLARRKASLRKPFDGIEQRWMRKAFAGATVIVTQNETQQVKLQQLYGREGFLFPQSAEKATNEANKSASPLKVCWIGNLKDVKRPELFLQLVNKFEKDQHVEFAMVGRPHTKYLDAIDSVSQRIPHFHYHGELTNDAVNALLARSHILVNTSDYEGFSNTFVQAWMRKVVVISYNSNPDELLTRKELGYVSNDTAEVEGIIRKLADDRALLEEKGNRALKHALHYHSFDTNIDKLMSKIEN